MSCPIYVSRIRNSESKTTQAIKLFSEGKYSFFRAISGASGNVDSFGSGRDVIFKIVEFCIGPSVLKLGGPFPKLTLSDCVEEKGLALLEWMQMFPFEIEHEPQGHRTYLRLSSDLLQQ